MKQIFDSMALELAKAAAEVAKLNFTMRSNLARWRKYHEASKRVVVLVDAQKRCAEAVNNASRFKVKKGEETEMNGDMHKLPEREKEVLKQALDSYADNVKQCLDFYYLSDIPKTAKEIEEQCLFLWPKKEEV